MMACNGRALFLFLLVTVVCVYAGAILVILRKHSDAAVILSSIHDVAAVLTDSRVGAAQQPLGFRDENGRLPGHLHTLSHI